MSTSFESRPDDGSVISLNDNERGPIDVNLRTHEDDFTYANEMYKAHREYVVHEDDFVNQRTTWAITIESFVIAIFGLTYQKKMEGLLTFHGLDDKKTTSAAIKINQFVELFDQRLNMIAVFGFAVAVISGIAVYAAQRSIFGVNTAWKKEMPQEEVLQ